jgi:hypothetical protein
MYSFKLVMFIAMSILNILQKMKQMKIDDYENKMFDC